MYETINVREKQICIGKTDIYIYKGIQQLCILLTQTPGVHCTACLDISLSKQFPHTLTS